MDRDRARTVLRKESLERFATEHPAVKTDANAQLAFIAIINAGEVGAAVLRTQNKVFRYAVSRGTKAATELHDVKPKLG